MEEVTVKVEAGIQPFGRPIAESAEAHEGEEGRLKAEAAKGHDSDKTAGAQERAVDESEDDGDDDADYKIVLPSRVDGAASARRRERTWTPTYHGATSQVRETYRR